MMRNSRKDGAIAFAESCHEGVAAEYMKSATLFEQLSDHRECVWLDLGLLCVDIVNDTRLCDLL
jgi:hypothetical protein